MLNPQINTLVIRHHNLFRRSNMNLGHLDKQPMYTYHLAILTQLTSTDVGKLTFNPVTITLSRPPSATSLLKDPSPLKMKSETASSSPMPGLLGYLGSAFDASKNRAQAPQPPLVADSLSAAYVLWCGKPMATFLRPSVVKCEYLYRSTIRGRSIVRHVEQIAMIEQEKAIWLMDSAKNGVWQLLK